MYLALARFGARRPLSRLPLSIQRDIKAFAGNYTAASEEANRLLFSVGSAEAIDEACRQSASRGIGYSVLGVGTDSGSAAGGWTLADQCAHRREELVAGASTDTPWCMKAARGPCWVRLR